MSCAMPTAESSSEPSRRRRQRQPTNHTAPFAFTNLYVVGVASILAVLGLTPFPRTAEAFLHPNLIGRTHRVEFTLASRTKTCSRAEVGVDKRLCSGHGFREYTIAARDSSLEMSAAEGTREGGASGASSSMRKPPTLPQGEFRPKQSLGQNYLTDQNYVMKICNHFGDTSEEGRTVVELGPGAGALTQVLYERFPDMLAVEIDQRAVELLGQSLPKLNVVMSDVLQIDYTKLAELRGGPLSVIGNLPYHITSQILFTLCDHYLSVRRAVVTMQLEVAQRITAKPSTKQYGILSVVFQLYTRPQILFQIPPTVFYPQPSVTSALISLDFTGEGPGVNQASLKSVLSAAFQQRRKMLRQSLKPLLRAGQTLPEEFATKRPEQLDPWAFVELTRFLFGDSRELPQGTKAWRGMRGNNRGAENDGDSAGASVREEGGEGGPGGYGGMV